MSLSLTLACGDYDRCRGLWDGSTPPAGIDLNYVKVPPAETFVRQENRAEFDVSEMSLSAYIIGLAQGDDRFIGIPAFPSRVFRHRDIYVNAAADIEKPEDLKGLRVALHRYHMTALVWQRGFLSDDYGVRAADVTWVKAGVDSAGLPPRRIELKLSDGIEVEHVTDASIDEMLVSGRVPAAILAFPPPSFKRGDERVHRLFADPRAVELDYFKRTGIFPMMHLIVMRREIHDAHPWAAQSLLAAFEASKQAAYQRMENFGYSESMLPFFHLDLEEIRRDFGKDFWPYGLESNRVALKAALRYAHEQGMTERRVEIEELFAPGALEPWDMASVGVVPGTAGAHPPATAPGVLID